MLDSTPDGISDRDNRNLHRPDRDIYSRHESCPVLPTDPGFGLPASVTSCERLSHPCSCLTACAPDPWRLP